MKGKFKAASSLRRLLSLTAMSTVALSGLWLTGCDWELSGGVSTVDTVVGSDWDRDPWDRDSWHRDPWHPVDDYRPAHERVGPGTGHGGCTMVTDSTGRIRSTCPGGFAGTLANPRFVLEASNPELKAQRIAEKYALPMEAAEKLSQLLATGKSGDASFITELGLGASDVRKMVLKGEATAQSVEALSQKLALNATMTKELVERIALEIRAQMADVESPAWKACRAGGRWKTDANGGTCKSTDWSGCSPATGAQFCFAAK